MNDVKGILVVAEKEVFKCNQRENKLLKLNIFVVFCTVRCVSN